MIGKWVERKWKFTNKSSPLRSGFVAAICTAVGCSNPFDFKHVTSVSENPRSEKSIDFDRFSIFFINQIKSCKFQYFIDRILF